MCEKSMKGQVSLSLVPRQVLVYCAGLYCLYPARTDCEHLEDLLKSFGFPSKDKVCCSSPPKTPHSLNTIYKSASMFTVTCQRLKQLFGHGVPSHAYAKPNLEMHLLSF